MTVFTGCRENLVLICVCQGRRPLTDISPVSRDRIGKTNPPYDQTYVISENLFQVADIIGDDKYRKHALPEGPHGTESLMPPIRIIKAYRKER